MIRQFPSELKDEVSVKMYRRLLEIYQMIYDLHDQVNAVGGGGKLTPLHVRQIKNALQSSGIDPLNVQGLLGVLAQAQVGGAPSFKTLPVPQDPRSQDGALGVLAGNPSQIYRYDQPSHTWLTVAATGIVSILLGAVAKGSRAILNFIAGNDVTLTIVDNPGNSRVDITIAVTGVTGWTNATGAASRAAYPSYTGQTITGPTIAEVQNIDNALVAASQALVAVINDLFSQGINRA